MKIFKLLLAIFVSLTIAACGGGGGGGGTPAAPSVPGVPSQVTATAGDTSANVSFAAAPDGGSTITSYDVTSSPGGFTATGTASPIAVTGLTNGTAYTFTVTATNSIGTGAASSASNSVTPDVVPGAPAIGTVSIGANGGIVTASVPFTAPVGNSGTAITGYTVTSSPGGITATGTSSPIAVSGLAYGTAYTFTVTATNAMGTGAASAASNSVSQAPAISAAPTIGVATAGNGQATVNFTAPADNGGSAITNYTVTSSPGNISSIGSTSPITVGGLTNFTTYTFTVTATNGVGTSTASAASNPVTPQATVPGAPTMGVVIATDRQASVNFTAPANNGGSPITGYTVTSNPGGITATGTASPIVVTGLTNGTAYTFTVTATNAAGTGAASAPSGSVAPVAVLQSISVSPVGLSIPVGATKQFTATGNYSDGTTQDLTASATWSSGNVLTASFPSTPGLARGNAAGTVLIYAASGAKMGTTNLTVTTPVAQGAANAPLVISAMPFNGQAATDGFTSSYYQYTTATDVVMITASNMTDDIDPKVYTDATFATLDANWTCTARIGMTTDTCTATTPVAAGTVLYIRAANFTAGGGVFTLDVRPLPVSQGAANAPLAITMPYDGQVAATGFSYYSYTANSATRSLITLGNLSNDADPKVYTDATFVTTDTNWTCTARVGTTNDTCTATTPVALGSTVYVRIKDWAGSGVFFTLQ